MQTSTKPWIDAYEPHEWEVYHLTIEEFPELAPCDTEYYITNAEAPMAEILWRNSPDRPVFYSDFEQIMAGLKGTGGSHFEIKVLAKDWRGHKAGALVHQCYTDVIYETPAKFTFLVESI